MKHLLFLLPYLLLLIPASPYSMGLDETLALYQAQEMIDQQRQEVNYWEDRLQNEPNQWLYQVQLAGIHQRLFQLTADISHLKRAEHLLLAVLEQRLQDPAPIQRTLARNYISQHRFCEALDLVAAAYESGSGKRASKLMLFDVYAELGDEYEQYRLLEELNEKRDFDYLIRLAKWEDSQGRLDHTLLIMEKAKAIAERSRQTSLMQWAYSNLGDYYGHSGEIELSQVYYEKALALDPADWYSMKGLAWILYSHENRPHEAARILTILRDYSQDPGIRLTLAEIKEYTGDSQSAGSLRELVATDVSKEDYGRMYAAFLCEYYLDKGENARALAIAQKEVSERPVPASYDLLIQARFAQGEVEAAHQLSREKVWHRTYEPGILLNQLRYFVGISSPYLTAIMNELSAACFELGPLVCRELD